ncbi:HNH endonuclease [Microbulbifer epialgicus]|uniref:HNH endonuclease n=1 Tax=Microbulbifer epialgicus TaxID=393907 RepID=A0ABV4P713_9GAMM
MSDRAKATACRGPDNLWLVDNGRNQGKGDKGPDEWMPPYKLVQAIYVQRFKTVMERYGLRFSWEESTQVLALLKE